MQLSVYVSPEPTTPSGDLVGLVDRAAGLCDAGELASADAAKMKLSSVP
jgi:hypothetical protein